MNSKIRLRIGLGCALLLSVGLAGCGSDDPAAGPTDPEDTAPPQAPYGLEGRWTGPNGFYVRWAPNAEHDLEGYRVFVKTPGAQVFVPINVALVARCQVSWTAPEGSPRGEYLVRVSAVDHAGNESQPSVALGLGPAEEPVEDATQDGSGDNPGGRGTTQPYPEPPDGGHGENPQDNDPNR